MGDRNDFRKLIPLGAILFNKDLFMAKLLENEENTPHPIAPQHIAIMMDGNRRWAKGKGLPIIMGHREGASVLKRIARHASNRGVQYLTVYAFSSENWRRSQSWIDDLMGLFRYYLKNEINELVQNNIRLRVIGDLSRFDSDIQGMILENEEKTSQNTGLALVVALNYGGRQDIVAACKKFSNELLLTYGDLSSGTISPMNLRAAKQKILELTEESFSSYLYTKEIPSPDLMIRPSGECRLSNFLLWQIAYSELVFSSKLWPDFTEADLDEAIRIYNSRDRRFGAKDPDD